MSKVQQLTVNQAVINFKSAPEGSYFSLTNMCQGFEGGTDNLEKWLRYRDTLVFMGEWESVFNDNFNTTAVEGIIEDSHNKNFSMSAKRWISKTNAIGIYSTLGKYGGTYAVEDIAMDFAMFLSPKFKLAMILELRRLRKFEADFLKDNQEIAAKRRLVATNYEDQTSAIDDCMLDDLPKHLHWTVYYKEADLLNVILFGLTNKEWEELNPELVKGCFVVCYGQTYYIGRKSTNRFEFNGTSKLDRMYYYRVREVDNSAGKSA